MQTKDLLQDIKFKKVILIAFVLTLAFCYFTRIKYINLDNAYIGFSPIEYAYKKILPEQFAKDYPNGTQAFDQSSIMGIYPLLLSSFNIPPEKTQIILLLTEYILIAFLFLYFSKIKFPSTYLIIGFLAFVWYVSSNVSNISIARYSKPFFTGLFYNYADLFRVIGILLFIQQKKILAALSLAFATSTHLLLGFIAFLFCFSILLFDKKQWFDKKNIWFLLIYISGTAAWVISRFDSALLFEIPNNSWVALTKLTSVHFYPIDFGVFSFFHEHNFFPHLAFLLLFIHYFPTKENLTNFDRQIAIGSYAMVALTIIGVVGSLSHSQTIIKCCLHRANDLVILLGLVYVVNGLLNDVLKDNLFNKFFAACIFLYPFFSRYQTFALFIIMLFVSVNVVKDTVNRKISFRYILAILIYILVGASLFYYHKIGLLKPVFSLSYLGEMWFWKWSLLATIIFLTIYFLFKKYRKNWSLIFFILLLAFGIAVWQIKSLPSHDYKKFANDYLQVQIWAKENSQKDALFFVDPSLVYGWRDYSQRSSFGTMREWVYGWTYITSSFIFHTGMERVALLDIHLEKYYNFYPSIYGFNLLLDDTRNIFYSKDENWFKAIHNKYTVDYIVLQKKYINRLLDFDKVYENDSFLVYRLKSQK